MGNLIAVGNLKGGTGKSTVASIVAQRLGWQAIDADEPQMTDVTVEVPRGSVFVLRYLSDRLQASPAQERVMADDPGVDMVCGSRFITDNGYLAPISRRTGIHIFAFLLSRFVAGFPDKSIASQLGVSQVMSLTSAPLRGSPRKNVRLRNTGCCRRRAIRRRLIVAGL